MPGALDFLSRLMAYAKACLAAATVLFLQSLLAPQAYPSPPALEEFMLRFGIYVFYVVLAGTPFAMIVLLLLRLTGRAGWAATIAGGAVAGMLPVVFLSVLLGEPSAVPAAMAMMTGIAGAVGGAVYYMAAPQRRLAS